MVESKDPVDDVLELIEALHRRVTLLEDHAFSTPRTSTLVERLVTSGDHDDLGSGERVVGYGGSGETENGVVLWQARRAWDEILGADPGPLAAVFSALANPMRIRIVAALAERALTTRLLLEALEEPTTGQLFHHLRDLLAADLVFQPVRGTYAIRHQHVVPLLAGLSAALDLGHHSSTEPERP